MRRTILIVSLSFLGCASVKSSAAPKKSYWASLDEGVLDPRAAFGPVTVIWMHPPQAAHATEPQPAPAPAR